MRSIWRSPRRRKVPTPGTFTLSLADSLWAQQDFSFLPAYLDTLAVDYGAGINLVDFVQAPESARAAINGWVSDETKGLIPMLLPTGSVDSNTRLVLANAVYFHGDWVTPFKSGSPNGTFHAAAGDVSVPMMSGAGNGMVWSGSGWTAASLPYDGGTTAMVLIVPDAGTFASFEAGLSADSLAAILSPDAADRPARSACRASNFRSAPSLAGALSSLGMAVAFSPAADLSGIDGGERSPGHRRDPPGRHRGRREGDDRGGGHRRRGRHPLGRAWVDGRPPVPLLHRASADRRGAVSPAGSSIPPRPTEPSIGAAAAGGDA